MSDIYQKFLTYFKYVFSPIYSGFCPGFCPYIYISGQIYMSGQNIFYLMFPIQNFRYTDTLQLCFVRCIYRKFPINTSTYSLQLTFFDFFLITALKAVAGSE